VVRKKVTGEWQRKMETTEQHRKMQMNGWAHLSAEGKLSMMKNNQAGLQSQTDDHCAEVDALIEENQSLMDSGDVVFEVSSLLPNVLHLSTPPLTYVNEPKPVITGKSHKQQHSYETG
jgi:hypothetical protein